MLAHGALGRLTAPKTSSRDLPQLARFLRRTLLSRNASSLPAVRAISRALTAALDASRSYATTATATKPTATVKKAVKAQAATKTPVKTKPAAKTTTKAATKKPAATKTTTKKPAVKKTAKKAVKKPAKKTAKKATPKKRVRKVKTPEEKEKAKLTELRKRALKEPVSAYTLSALHAYLQDHASGKGQSGTVTTRLAETSRAYKSLTPAEHEHYNHLARERTAARQAEYRAWVHTHTPQQIHDANLARAQLRRMLKNATKRRYPANTVKIIDDRHVKRGKSPYNIFFGERMQSGDMKNIKTTDAATLASAEWKALSAGEKKKYEDEAAVDNERYKREIAAQA